MSTFSDYAVMVLCAGDVDQIWHSFADTVGDKPGNPGGNPTLPAPGAAGIAYVTSQNWDVLGQMRCNDLYIAKQLNCYYGLLLRCKAAVGPVGVGDYLVAVRGTMDPLEWANDATAEIPDYQPGVLGGVGTGFWDVYSSMTFCDLTGAVLNAHATAGIAAIVKAAPTPVFVTGHSLGSALATYLTADLLTQFMGTNVTVTPFFFASPKPGTQDYADNYQQAVATYTVVNFAADLVPMLPSSPPFVALNGGGPSHDVHIIPRNAPGAPPFPQLDPAKNHNPAYYAVMLDPTNAIAQGLLPK
jgi:hypothetical protein